MLLTSRHTVMAHAPFLTADDLALFRTRGAAVAHCPLSNFYYANSVFPIRRARAAGVMVGMGTDVGGAPSSCMFQACRDSVAASKALQDGVSPLGGAVSRPPDMPGASINHGMCAPPILTRVASAVCNDCIMAPVEAFYVATMGGAKALGIDKQVGTFAVGKVCDCVRCKQALGFFVSCV